MMRPRMHKAARMPWKRGLRRCSAISHAAVNAKHGFKNSLGWNRVPAIEIQRAAPFASAPMTSVSSVATRAPMQPRMARRFTRRGGIIDTPAMMPKATARKTNCLTMNASREKLSRLRWMCSATEGLAASTIT